MFRTILAVVVLVFGLALLAYATIGRYFGIHRPRKWGFGSDMSLAAEIAMSSFVICWALALLQDSPIWFLPGVAAWVIGYCSQERARRLHAAEENELRARNSAKFPGVFDHPPPSDIDQIPGDEIDLYDAAACTHLGTVSKRDIQAVIKRFSELPEQGPNDNYLEEEFLQALPEDSVSQRFFTILNAAFEHRDHVVLRWMPVGSADTAREEVKKGTI